MTRVEISSDGGMRRLTATGHAGDVESCNYITGILYALAGFAVNEQERGKAEAPRLEMEPGRVVMELRGGERMDTALEMAAIGLMQLAGTRPGAVSVEISWE